MRQLAGQREHNYYLDLRGIFSVVIQDKPSTTYYLGVICKTAVVNTSCSI
jgi:hypothetical protein